MQPALPGMDIPEDPVQAALPNAQDEVPKLSELPEEEFRSRAVATFQELQARLEQLTSEFTASTQKLIEISERIERLDARIERVDARVDKLG